MAGNKEESIWDRDIVKLFIDYLVIPPTSFLYNTTTQGAGILGNEIKNLYDYTSTRKERLLKSGLALVVGGVLAFEYTSQPHEEGYNPDKVVNVNRKEVEGKNYIIGTLADGRKVGFEVRDNKAELIDFIYDKKKNVIQEQNQNSLNFITEIENEVINGANKLLYGNKE